MPKKLLFRSSKLNKSCFFIGKCSVYARTPVAQTSMWGGGAPHNAPQMHKNTLKYFPVSKSSPAAGALLVHKEYILLGYMLEHMEFETLKELLSIE